jgi:uncharacterized Fe-S cluster protein YjdI/CDGSH-type Zn-finger protein
MATECRHPADHPRCGLPSDLLVVDPGTLTAMPARSYETDELIVDWYPERCVHTARCLRAHPAVFDTSRRPWVVLENGETADIIAAVEACPTGALRYRRTDGTGEVGPEETVVFPVQNGPLVLRGRLRVLADDGTTFTDEARLALCRCGHSANQPFCDNSHRRVSFESRSPTPAPLAPDAPDEVCPPQDESFERSD